MDKDLKIFLLVTVSLINVFLLFSICSILFDESSESVSSGSSGSSVQIDSDNYPIYPDDKETHNSVKDDADSEELDNNVEEQQEKQNVKENYPQLYSQVSFSTKKSPGQEESLIITNLGGGGIENISGFQISGDYVPNGNLDTRPGSTVTATRSTPDRGRLIITGINFDGSRQVLFDRYV